MIFKMIRERRLKRQVAEMRAEKDAACARGEHVPCRYCGETPEDDEYFCQECFKPMTLEEHTAYFSTPEMVAWRKRFDEYFGDNW